MITIRSLTPILALAALLTSPVALRAAETDTVAAPAVHDHAEPEATRPAAADAEPITGMGMGRGMGMGPGMAHRHGQHCRTGKGMAMAGAKPGMAGGGCRMCDDMTAKRLDMLEKRLDLMQMTLELLLKQQAAGQAQ